MSNQTSTYVVTGMSCGHCVAAITDEVGQVPGVMEVHVDLDAKVVTVTADAIDDQAIRAAIVEAGFAANP